MQPASRSVEHRSESQWQGSTQARQASAENPNPPHGEIQGANGFYEAGKVLDLIGWGVCNAPKVFLQDKDRKMTFFVSNMPIIFQSFEPL